MPLPARLAPRSCANCLTRTDHPEAFGKCMVCRCLNKSADRNLVGSWSPTARVWIFLPGCEFHQERPL